MTVIAEQQPHPTTGEHELTADCCRHERSPDCRCFRCALSRYWDAVGDTGSGLAGRED